MEVEGHSCNHISQLSWSIVITVCQIIERSCLREFGCKTCSATVLENWLCSRPHRLRYLVHGYQAGNCCCPPGSTLHLSQTKSYFEEMSSEG